MTDLELAYLEGHKAGWFQEQDIPEKYNIGELAAEFAQGYLDGRQAELSSRHLLQGLGD